MDATIECFLELAHPMRANDQSDYLNCSTIQRFAAGMSLAFVLTLPGCFSGKDSKLSQNPAEAAEGSGTSVVDLDPKPQAQQVAYSSDLENSAGAVHANFQTSNGKEYVDQISYDRLKQNLPARSGSSINSVTFDQFLKTDYDQLNKESVAKAGVSEPFPDWANKTPSVPAAGVTEVAFAKPQNAANSFRQLPPSGMPQPPASWGIPNQSPPPAVGTAPAPGTASLNMLSAQQTSPTASTPQQTASAPRNPLAARYAQASQAQKAPTTVAGTSSPLPQTPVNAQASAPASQTSPKLVRTRIKIELEEAKLRLHEGKAAEAKRHIDEAKYYARFLPQPLDNEVVREIAVASLELNERLLDNSSPSQMAHSSIAQTRHVTTPSASARTQDISLASNSSIAKLMGASSVKITPRTTFIDLARDPVNSMTMGTNHQAFDEVADFQNSIAMANQPVSLPAYQTSTTTRLPAWDPSPSPIGNVPESTNTTTLPPISAVSPVNSFANLPMELPTQNQLAMADTHVSLPGPPLKAPEVAFNDGQETPVLTVPSTPDLSSVPSPVENVTLEARDSRLQIPSWVTYGVIISLLALLTLAFRRM